MFRPFTLDELDEMEAELHRVEAETGRHDSEDEQ